MEEQARGTHGSLEGWLRFAVDDLLKSDPLGPTALVWMTKDGMIKLATSLVDADGHLNRDRLMSLFGLIMASLSGVGDTLHDEAKRYDFDAPGPLGPTTRKVEA